MSPALQPQPRIVSLDQFRGYAVLGMFVVNFVGSFDACHAILQHHNTYLSYADTIMPQFFFAVGFAFRLTFTRRLAKEGAKTAYLRFVRRLLGLLLVALVVYTVSPRASSWNELRAMSLWEIFREPLKRTWFQTLTHIAVTSLWVLPVVGQGPWVRLGFLLGSAALHAALSAAFYFHWVNNGQPNGIDGGPLGFLTWTVPMIAGTLGCDAVLSLKRRLAVPVIAAGAVLFMTLGYLLSCGTRLYDTPPGQYQADQVPRLAADPVVPSAERLEQARRDWQAGRYDKLLAEPPFTPPPHSEGRIADSYRYRQWNYWMMSQRSGTLSYLTFASGFSLAVYLFFLLLCDVWKLQLGLLRTLGSNALAAYVLHMMVQPMVQPFMPHDCPAWYMWCGCALFLTVVYVLVRGLERSGLYIRV